MKKILLIIAVMMLAINVFAAKNVILMIGDGMGINSVKMTNYYTGKELVFQKFDTKCFATTYSVNAKSYDSNKAWKDASKNIPNWEYLSSCTDSAAAATALNSGLKTLNGVVNRSPEGKLYITLAQVLKKLGYSIGDVTTVRWNDATPSGVYAHSMARGSNEITYEMINSKVANVLSGAGTPVYDGYGNKRETPVYDMIPKDLWDDLQNGKKDYKVIETKKDINVLASSKNPKGNYLLSVPSSGDLAYTKVPEFADPKASKDLPTLAEISLAAVNVVKENPKGFYLMIEGGSIDHANHANNAKECINQTISFNEAVSAMVDWVNKNSNWEDTVIIVTADHETGQLANSNGTYYVGNNGKSKMPDYKYNSNGHSNIPVPVFVKGDFGKNILKYANNTDPVLGKYIDNTDITKFMGEFYGVEMPVKLK